MILTLLLCSDKLYLRNFLSLSSYPIICKCNVGHVTKILALSANSCKALVLYVPKPVCILPYVPQIFPTTLSVSYSPLPKNAELLLKKSNIIVPQKNIGSIISPKYAEHLKTIEAKENIVKSFLQLHYNILFDFKKMSTINAAPLITIVQDKNSLFDGVSHQMVNDTFVEMHSYKIINKKAVINTVFPESLQKDSYIVKNMIDCLNNPTIPATNWTLLLYFERTYSKLKIPRGFILNSLIEHVNDNTNVVHKIIVHNVAGIGDVNFISELNHVYRHAMHLKNHVPQFEIQRYHLLHSNKVGSPDHKGSLFYTDQQNCDCKLIIKHLPSNTILIRYLDIKQKELDITLDVKYLYLKINYVVKGDLKNTQGILDNIHYSSDYLKMCERHLSRNMDDAVQKFLTKFKSISSNDKKMNLLHEFVLLHAENPKMRMTVMFSIEISPKESVFDDIAKHYAPQVQDDIFANQHSFNQLSSELMYKALPQKSETSPRFERMKKDLITDALNDLKIRKSKFTPDFVERNYTGFSDIIDSKE